MYCLQCFSSDEVLTNHEENGVQVNGTQGIEMSTEGNNNLTFNNRHKQVAFVISADFEAITENVHSRQPANDKSFTEAYQKHRDCGYGYKVVCCYNDKYSKPVEFFSCEKAVFKFSEFMLEEIKYCRKTINKHLNKSLKILKTDEEDFQKAVRCHIFETEYYNEADVREDQDCNLNFQLTGKIPVVFHNLRGYDNHFIMQNIGEIIKKHAFRNKRGEEKQHIVNAIPNNMGKYMAFSEYHEIS